LDQANRGKAWWGTLLCSALIHLLLNMESLKSALYALYDAAEGDLLDLIHLEYYKANKTAKKLQLLLTLPAS
jgi:hypothetical protein